MSAQSHAAPAHGAGDGHGHSHGGEGHGSLKGYVIGFVLSVILTAIPFWLVMADVFGNSVVTALIVMEIAVLQIFVHMYYFLHMNTSSQGGWTMMALIFTVVVVLITFIGSMWVMHHLNSYMMPMSAEHMRQVP
jgi:cytochrome o ubiquinol oxidase operon protein cyoD